jgi:hypothetical protein
VPWLISSILQKVYFLQNTKILSAKKLSIAISKRSWLLMRALKVSSSRYDWVIAHNPAAFFPAYYYGNMINAKVGFDIEDYHPGESNNYNLNKYIKIFLQKMLPTAFYCSYSAPLIAQQFQGEIHKLKNKQIILLNGFPSYEFTFPKINNSRKLKLVWFSQNINQGRGLENIICSMYELHPFVELHLIGYPDVLFVEKYISGVKGVFLHNPLPQAELHRFLSNFDIGLALDLPINRNRELAITNKIIAYAQAGLYILGFYSKGQVEFLTKYNLHHAIVENKIEAICMEIRNIKKNKIQEIKLNQYELGKQLAWEHIKKKLALIWKFEDRMRLD